MSDVTKTTKGGNIILERVRVPGSVQPGEAFDVEVDVSNGAVIIGPFDPDAYGNAGGSGYNINVTATVDGTEKTKDTRIGVAEVGTKDATYTFTFEAPRTDGTVDVSGRVELPASGKTTGPVRTSTVVSADDPADAPNPDDDGTDNSNPFANLPFPDDDGGGGNPFNPLGSGLPSGDAVLLVVGLLALAWLASSAEGVVN